jgi:hypothetical protein
MGQRQLLAHRKGQDGGRATSVRRRSCDGWLASMAQGATPRRGLPLGLAHEEKESVRRAVTGGCGGKNRGTVVASSPESRQSAGGGQKVLHGGFL